LKKIIFVALIVLCTACSNFDQKEFVESDKIQNFPIPKQAKLTNSKVTNTLIEKHAKYKLNNIGGEQGLSVPKEYISQIEDWGWKEQEKERIGSKYIFKKNQEIVWLIVKENQFSISKITTP
jgi:hypothetical protein